MTLPAKSEESQKLLARLELSRFRHSKNFKNCRTNFALGSFKIKKLYNFQSCSNSRQCCGYIHWIHLTFLKWLPCIVWSEFTFFFISHVEFLKLLPIQEKWSGFSVVFYVTLKIYELAKLNFLLTLGFVCSKPNAKQQVYKDEHTWI